MRAHLSDRKGPPFPMFLGEQCRLTRRSSGRSKACCARFRTPLIFNVMPLERLPSESISVLLDAHPN